MRNFISCFFILASLFLCAFSFGQCPNPQLFDLQLLQASPNPRWVNKIENQAAPDEFTLDLYSPVDIHNYTIDFGDGSPVISGALWEAGTPISNTYPLGMFTVTLTETLNGCTRTITGTLINDRKPGAVAFPPTDNSNGCVPHSLTFINQTHNVSPFTRFFWDWGDGVIEEADASTVGQPISHTYVKGSSGCNMTVKLSAISLSDSSFSIYGPYDMWDVDSTSIIASALEICSGDSITFTDNTLYNCNQSARRIQWDLREIGGVLTPWLPNTPQNRVRRAYVAGPVGSEYTVSLADSNICGVRAFSVTVRIIAAPTAVIQPDKYLVCVNEPITFHNQSIGSASRYRWDFGDNNELIVSNRNSQVYAYDQPGIYDVKLVAAVAGSTQCTDSTTVQVEVLPTPVSGFTADVREGCSPLTVNISNTSVNATNYKWFLNGNLISELSVPENLSFDDPGVYELKLVAGNEVDCESFSTTTFYSYPQVLADAEIEAGCNGFPIRFFDRSELEPWGNQVSDCAAGNILKEQFAGLGGVDVNISAIANMPPLANNSSLLPSFSTGSHYEENLGTRVRGFICPPQNGNYRFWISADGIAELWLSTDANPANKTRIAFLNTGVEAGQWDVYISQRSDLVNLVAGRKYFIEALYKKDAFRDDHLQVGWQVPSSATRQLPISGDYLSPFVSGVDISSWQWDFGDGVGGSNERNPQYTYQNPGEYTVSLTVGSTRCSSTQTFTVNIEPSSVADFSIDDAEGCASLTTNIRNLSAHTTDYRLHWGDGSEPVVPADDWSVLEHTFVNNTQEVRVFNIKLVTENATGCKDSIVRQVVVHPAPPLDFTYNPTLPGCSPLDINFNIIGTGFSEFRWYFGDQDTLVTTQNTASFSFINRTMALKYDTVTLSSLATGGCLVMVKKVIASYPEVDPEIIFTDNQCSGATTKFSAPEPYLSYAWDFGDGTVSSASSPEKIFVNVSDEPLNLDIALVARNAFGCIGRADTVLTIFPKPMSSFGFLQPENGCTPLTLTLDNTSSTENGETYYWDLGNGIETVSDIEFDRIWHNAGVSDRIVQVRLRVENSFGCMDSTSRNVTIYPKPRADFDADKYIGCTPLEVNFSNTSTGATSYLWYTDVLLDNKEDLTHTFINTGPTDQNHGISLVAITDRGCRDTIQKQIVTVNRPVSMFSISDVSLYKEDTLFLTNTSEGGIQYTWSFGDGTSSTDANRPYHIYSEEGNYNIVLTVANAHCSATFSREVTVMHIMPIADFEGTGEGCSTTTVTFKNNSQYANRFLWDFGDGNTLETTSKSDITYTFHNRSTIKKVFHVKLIAYNSGGQSEMIKYESIVLMPMPDVDFSPRPQTVNIPGEVTFVNDTKNATHYEWDFGDGGASAEREPKHTYYEEGNYDITLIATSEYGCTATLTLPAAIVAKETGRVVMPNAFTPRTGGSGGNQVGLGLNDVFSPGFQVGVEEYSLLIFNKWGALIFESYDINIGWDGYFENTLCEEGVYVYKVKARLINGNMYEEIGDVTLLREF